MKVSVGVEVNSVPLLCNHFCYSTFGLPQFHFLFLVDFYLCLIIVGMHFYGYQIVLPKNGVLCILFCIF